MDDPQTVSKRTRGQKVILAYLQQLHEPISAQALFARLRNEGSGLGLATVYRALEGLKREGLIHRKISPEGEALHSLAQPGSGYLTCLHCGESTLIQADKEIWSPPDPVSESASAFQILYHTWESFGICGQCQFKA
ncbi:MAG: transcriptional repressor [Synechococcaceae cyanobacterium SM2_3_1]|nr:transcriptional repressor [Synechococcaceae cyanobacterium SM2_3_1]